VFKVLEAAIKKAGSADPDDIAKTLSDGLEVNGALGKITYRGGASHNPQTEVALVRVHNGKFELVEKGVPEDVPEP
jgi:ABC-type branched-subunit amino acid transport system substrate-binding protein